MHVMHLLGNFGLGGAERGVVRLISGMKNKAVTHSVCSIRSDVRMKRCLPPEIDCYSLKIDRRNWTAFATIARLLKNTKPDIVHVNNLAPWFDVALASRLTGCQCIQTFHGVETSVEQFPFYRSFLWRLASIFTASITAVAPSAVRLFSELTGIDPKRVQVIPNGVDISLFRPASDQETKRSIRQRFGLPDPAFLFGCVAALRPVKNHQGLIEAFAEALQSLKAFPTDSQAFLVLVGQGPLETYLDHICHELHVENQVLFMGQQTEIPSILQAFDCFVMNSRTEGMSYAILEAMACGLPVIATNVGGNSELVDHGTQGYLFSPEDRMCLAGYISQAAQSRELMKSMGLKARKKISKSYSIANMIAGYDNLYASLKRSNL